MYGPTIPPKTTSSSTRRSIKQRLVGKSLIINRRSKEDFLVPPFFYAIKHHIFLCIFRILLGVFLIFLCIFRIFASSSVILKQHALYGQT